MYRNQNEYAKKCARELRADKIIETGKPLTDYERGWRRAVLEYRAQETTNWRHKQKYKNVQTHSASPKSKPAQITRQYTKADLQSIFADNDIFEDIK